MESNIDLLLVNPGGFRKKVYQNLSKDYSAIEPPFWAALTAEFIRNKGYNVSILDANAENIDMEESVKAIEDYNPRLTNIVVYGQHPSASTALMPAVGELCNKIKKNNHERKIILTGLHPSSLPERTMKEESCDFVAEGEGFYTLEGLLKNKNINEIPGLWYRKDSQINFNPKSDNIKNLNLELSGVAWDLLPMNKYKAHNWHCFGDLKSRLSYTSVSTTLGCPFKCEFCCINAPFGSPSYRSWSQEWALNQIEILVEKYNVKNLKIIDELFVLNPNHFIEISKGIIDRNYNLNIWAYARVDTVKEKYLSILKKAGFNWLGLGIESGSEEIRGKVEKGKFNRENIKKIIKTIKNSGINVAANYIFGLPGDNLDTMQKTLDLAIDLNCEWVNFYCAMAYPGSKLYDQAIKNNWKLPDSWIGYSQYAYECQPMSTDKISAEEILKFRDNAFSIYFKNSDYLNMIEKKFDIDTKKHIEAMTKIKLKRKILGQ